MSRLIFVCFATLSMSALAQPTLTLDPPLRDTWSNRASFFVGLRGGVAVPPGATELAPNVSIEAGVAPTTGFGLGVRLMWMNAPPGAPFLNINPARYGFGALADFRYYVETIAPLIFYPTLSIGFLAGPDAITNRNSVLPLFNPGLGIKLKFGNLYTGLEFGVSGFTIPFIAITLGFEGDSKLDREREARRRALAEAPPVAPTPVAPTAVAPPTDG